jgi:hypothetical protein
VRISKADVIGGLPAETARDLLRRMGFDATTDAVAQDVLGADTETVRQHLAALTDQGFLTASVDEDGVRRWQRTIQGNALAIAKFLRPIPRAKAEQLLSDVIARTSAYNADPTRLLAVTAMTVYGSYLDPDRDEMGDLDLAYTWAHRFTGDEHTQRSLRQARDAGRTGVMTQLHFIYQDLTRRLKNRSPYISLSDADVSTFTDRFEVVYRISDDPAAIELTPSAAAS